MSLFILDIGCMVADTRYWRKWAGELTKASLSCLAMFAGLVICAAKELFRDPSRLLVKRHGLHSERSIQRKVLTHHVVRKAVLVHEEAR